MTYVAIREQTAHELEQVARTRSVDKSELAEQAIRQYLRAEKDRAIEREAEAFRRLHSDLLAKIADQYAAIYQGNLVDHDPSLLALFLRIEATYPEMPVLIRKVRPEVEHIINVTSFRFEDA